MKKKWLNIYDGSVMSLDDQSQDVLKAIQSSCKVIDNLPADKSKRAADLKQQITALRAAIMDHSTALTFLEQDTGSADKLAEAAAHSKARERNLSDLLATQKEYQNTISELQGAITLASQGVLKQRNQIRVSREQAQNYDKLLRQRMHVAATRDRMLQLSQERNIYKKKIIYVLLSVIIGLIVAIIATYSFFGKK